MVAYMVCCVKFVYVISVKRLLHSLSYATQRP